MWRELFFNNISTYIALINEHLSKSYEPKPLNEYFDRMREYKSFVDSISESEKEFLI